MAFGIVIFPKPEGLGTGKYTDQMKCVRLSRNTLGDQIREPTYLFLIQYKPLQIINNRPKKTDHVRDQF